MRIVRAPLRITLGGGGTDLPGYYEKHGGFLISAAIDKYIYMTGSLRPFDKKFWLSYSDIEVLESTAGIKHDLFRKCLERFRFDNGVELHSISELPGNNGLGSSGSFLVCAITLLNSLAQKEMTRRDVAELASRIEMLELGHSCGKQDHYIAAFGGIITLEINRRGAVAVRELPVSRAIVRRLEHNLLLYHTGFSRKAETVLKAQTRSLKKGERSSLSSLMLIKELGLRSRDCLVAGDLDAFGRLLHEHWQLKRSMQAVMSNPRIDAVYDAALKAGMLGGKVIGAGGGGFFMFYVPDERQTHFRSAMRGIGLIELDWRFSFSGCEVVFAN